MPARTERVKNICQSCGKEIVLQPAEQKQGRGKFCSRACYWQSLRIDLGKTSCPVCGTMFDVTVKRHKYCCRSCAERDQRTRPASTHPSFRGGRINLTCGICGKMFQRHPGKGNQQFCSTKCAGEARSRWPKEQHPRWLGGVSFIPYPTTFDRTLKDLIRERDGYECLICHRPGKPVHHVNYDKADCGPLNLAMLCSRCHAKTNAHRDGWQRILADVVSSKPMGGFLSL